MKIILIYITTEDKEQARTIGKALVETKLAACVNIIENMNSMYMWQGKLQDDKEVILIAKTTETRVPELVATIKAMQSCDCPCIMSIPVAGGNESFLEWIANEVKS